jgi:predicted MFS family arabinose efflux permease
MLSGPALGGALVEAIGATTTLIADAASFIVSFASLALIPSPHSDTHADPIQPQALRRQIADGLAYLRSDRTLLAITGATAGANLWLMALNAVEVVFLVRDVRVPAGWIGVLFALSGAGGLVGSLTARRLTDRFGLSRVACSALAVTAPAALLIPLAQHGVGVTFFVVASPIISFGIALVSVAFQTLRLDRCPPQMIGRLATSSRSITALAIPLGALGGGALGQLVGARLALLVMAASYVGFGFILLRSPLRAAETSKNRQLVMDHGSPGKR